MGTIFIILGVFAALGAIIALFSANGSPKDRAKEAASGAGAGAMVGVSCLLQLVVPAIMLLIGLWLLKLIFG
jgi:hypothetical protein